jgi:hypothetical protein
MTTPTAPTQFRIVTDGPRATIEVDGRDLTDVSRGYLLTHQAGELPHLTVDLIPRAGDVSGLGNVTINRSHEDVQAEHRELQAMTVAWLRSIASSEQVAAEVQASLPSMAADPYAATAHHLADLLEQMLDHNAAPAPEHVEVTTLGDDMASYVSTSS